MLVTEEGGSSVAVTSTAAVADAPLTVDASSPATIVPAATIPWSGMVASFADPSGALPAGSYQTTIDWGDGSTPTPGTVTAAGGAFSVSGSHTYAAAGPLTATVTVSDPGGSTLSIRTPVQVQPAPAPLATPTPTPVATPSPTPTTVLVLPFPTPTPTATATPASGGGSTNGGGQNGSGGGQPLLQVLDGSGAPSQMLLTAGCNQVAVGAPGGTSMRTIAAMVDPQTAIMAIWRFNNATKQFDAGYFADPSAPTDPRGNG